MMSEMNPRPRSLAAQWITAVVFVGCLGVALWFALNLEDDPDALVGLAIPALLAGAGFAAARFAQPIVLWVISGMLLVFSVLAVFSVGLFILPFALLMLVAAGMVQLARDRWAARTTAAQE